MENIGPLLLSLIAGISTVLGMVFLYIKTNKINEYIVFSLSLSFIILLCISLFDLIPNSLLYLIGNYKLILGVILSILVFILGFTLIDYINSKITIKNNSSLYRVGILSMIALILHNVPEGIAIYISSNININYGIKLFIAIMIHNIIEGIIIAVPIYYSTNSKIKALLYTLIAGLSEPLGAVMSYLLLRNYLNELILSFILIFVSGLMINLAINDILKEALKYKKKLYMKLGIIIGLIIFIVLSLF